MLRMVVERAWERGASIDLAGIGYGRIHWGNEADVSTHPFGYYRTLAGVAALSGAKTAIEIGTHWGGSAVAILRGMRTSHADASMITIDVSEESNLWLPQQPESAVIRKIVGDANAVDTIETVQRAVERVDFLYVDADHFQLPTLLNFCVYVSLFKPKVALFDDIMFNEEMKRFWGNLQRAYPENTVNCVDIIPDTRDPYPPCGFGLWVCPEHGLDMTDPST